MNQIEFIKKWAKEDDRIEDGEEKFLYTGQSIQVFRIKNWRRSCLSDITWQSPEIYRLTTKIPYADRTGYNEKWELVADYADEVKKDEKSLIEQYLNGVGLLDTNQFRNVLIDVEKRLKALEDKLK